jgi:hypothetical protein
MVKKQFKVALSDEMKAKLEELAGKSDRSIADEIRQRIEWSLLDDEPNSPIWKLNREIRRLVRDVQYATGLSWHAHPLAHTAFVEAIATLLEDFKPPISSTESGPTEAEQQEAKAVGRAIARLIQHDLRHRQEQVPLFKTMREAGERLKLHAQKTDADKRTAGKIKRQK